MPNKTIAAISTPIGEGGIGVIRISGDEAIAVAERCFRAFSGKKLSSLKGYSALYGEIIDGERVIDDCVALVFRAPKSYTGEDTVEISVHSGSVVLKKVLRAVLESGAVHAEAGEFTKRAFLNGKMDLLKAESVMDIITAKSEGAYNISLSAREGKISEKTEALTSSLLGIAASMAAYSDYPDEDIEGLNTESFLSSLVDAKTTLQKLIESYDTGRMLKEGIDCAIVGKPNVGKSTLMNMLSGYEKSIVTEVAGTTRDVVEANVTLGDIILNLSDTAGIHDTADKVEKIGVEKAREKLGLARLVLAVFDCSEGLDQNDFELLYGLDKKKTIVILNKSDLVKKTDESAFEGFNRVEISAKNGEGASELHKKIAELCDLNSISPDDAVLTTERQRDCAKRALGFVTEAISALSGGVTTDAVGVILDEAIAALFEISGKRVTNEVANEVFARFCVGK